MIRISKEDYKLRLTKRDEINIDEMNESHLKIYLSMYSLYMEWLLNLLILKTNILDIDIKFRNSNLLFKKINNNKLDFYQKFSIEYLDYFYVRNNLYLYRLNKEEYDFMIERIKDDNYVFDEDVTNFILDTYKKVIYEKVDGYENIKVNHDRTDMGRYIFNNSIIIGFRYDKFNNLNDEQWYINLNKQEEFVNKYTQILIENIHETFQWTVTLLEYK